MEFCGRGASKLAIQCKEYVKKEGPKFDPPWRAAARSKSSTSSASARASCRRSREPRAWRRSPSSPNTAAKPCPVELNP
ncbi:hypothetical protein MUK42_37529 [Musa troglodytarum]|uniref:Uncharacterized protein n=1 Tax=Musa troglodytarum TaxID=320322 RepID=A0A9E7E7X3_9LILI|nr:hypothetical protein MUK42_37529 [Musa troglodytarum]